MELSLNEPAYVMEQYRDRANLDARIALHARFSTATRELPEWIFDHFDWSIAARILELGCGTGMLWKKNASRVRATWRLTLTDFSFGMAETARATGTVANFVQSDAQAIPFRDAYFDAVIANHMLYHVPDLDRALGEIRRVLKPGSRFYAATNGINHMREYFDLMSDFLEIGPLSTFTHFTLENGAELLGKFFSEIHRYDFSDCLNVTEVEPLVAYAMSGVVGKRVIGNERDRKSVV